MIHHVLLEVSDLEGSARFYDAMLGPLGWRRHHDQDGAIGWGIAKPVFYVTEGRGSSDFGVVSFSAPGIAAVKAAWEGGVASGGTSVAEPGPSGGRGPYMAALRDPEGHRLELCVSPD